MSEEETHNAPIAPEAQPEEINASCRGPVLFLFFSAAVWAVQATGVGPVSYTHLTLPTKA